MVVCAGVPDGEAVALGDGATVFVVCGWVPPGDALGNGYTVAVGTGVDCNGVTVAVGCGPAGMLAEGAVSVCPITEVTVSARKPALTKARAKMDFLLVRILA